MSINTLYAANEVYTDIYSAFKPIKRNKNKWKYQDILHIKWALALKPRWQTLTLNNILKMEDSYFPVPSDC